MDVVLYDELAECPADITYVSSCETLHGRKQITVNETKRAFLYYKLGIYVYADDDEGRRYIFHYDILTNEWNKIQESLIPSYEPISTAIATAIDNINGKIFAFSDNGNKSEKNNVAIFDIAQKQWNILRNITSSHFIGGICGYVSPTICYLNEPINKLHVLYANSHYRFDTKKFTRSAGKLYGANYPIMTYVPSMKKLFVFGASAKQECNIYQTFVCDEIVYCTITDSKQKTFVWEKYKLKLPWPIKDKDHFVLAFGHIVFMLSQLKIVCIDLLNENIYNLNKKLPCEFYKIVKTEDNHIHCFKTAQDDNKHIKIFLFELLPAELCRIGNIPLVFGYVKETEQKYSFVESVPVYVKRIIIEYLSQ